MLEEANFEVDAALDLGQSDMLGAVRDFAGRLSDKDKDSVALIYFAGHGIQIDGENYPSQSMPGSHKPKTCRSKPSVSPMS